VLQRASAPLCQIYEVGEIETDAARARKRREFNVSE